MLTIWMPTTITRAASAGSGIRSITGTSSRAASTIHRPCSMVEARLTAPAVTLATLRTATPATGSPPSAPETTFAMPWPASSRSRAVRGMPRPWSGRAATSLSTATAESSDCTLVTRVIVSTPAAMPRTGPSGSPGRAWLLQDGRSTRGTASPASTATAVAPATATSAAGALRRNFPARPGRRGQQSRAATVSALMANAAGWTCANWAGRPRALSTAELWGVPPSTMCSWARAMVTPMPPSMPCTIAGETASAERATRSADRPIWASPARTVMAQVVRQP